MQTVHIIAYKVAVFSQNHINCLVIRKLCF